MYRYRCNKGATRHVRAMFVKCVKLGLITQVKGVRYQGKFGLNEVVVVVGTHGTARFDGMCWSYQGEGPRALRDLLQFLGIKKSVAAEIAFTAPRNSTKGTDWRIDFRPASSLPLRVEFVNECDNLVTITYPNPNPCERIRPVELLGGQVAIAYAA